MFEMGMREFTVEIKLKRYQKSFYYKLILLLFQRDARGSVTFKIVPSYRSAPPPCEVSENKKTFLFCAKHP